jgi:hypothetical protein
MGAPPTITVLAFWAEADCMLATPSRATSAREAKEIFMKLGKRKVGVVVLAPTALLPILDFPNQKLISETAY